MQKSRVEGSYCTYIIFARISLTNTDTEDCRETGHHSVVLGEREQDGDPSTDDQGYGSDQHTVQAETLDYQADQDPSHGV